MTRQVLLTSLYDCRSQFLFMASAPDPTKVFNEKLNGRLAMLGLTIGLVTEWITGQGIIQQVFGIFN